MCSLVPLNLECRFIALQTRTPTNANDYTFVPLQPKFVPLQLSFTRHRKAESFVIL